jgi:hypothetical protein
VPNIFFPVIEGERVRCTRVFMRKAPMKENSRKTDSDYGMNDIDAALLKV